MNATLISGVQRQSSLERWLKQEIGLSLGITHKYNASDHQVLVHLTEDPSDPSKEYPWLQYVVFASCVPVAFMLVFLVQETRASQPSQG